MIDVFFFKKYLFIYFWLGWVFTAAYNFPPVAVRVSYSLAVVPGLLLAVASLIAELCTPGLQWLQHMSSIVAAPLL